MVTQKLIPKSAFIILVVLVAGAACGNIRTLLWDDPFCNTFSADGKYCLKCSFHYWMDKYGQCHPVSDWCKTWDDSNGHCTSCFPGYGSPVKGVCGSNPDIGNGTTGDDVSNCVRYEYIDVNKKFHKSWFTGCKKVCVECEYGYYLNYKYQCVALPENCKEADAYGKCIYCKKGYSV